MTKEELEREAEEYSEERCKDCYMCSADGKRNKCHFYTKRVEGYLASAEPREKQIAELEEAKANLEYLLEGRDNEIDELKKENKNLAQNLEDTEILNNTYEKRFDNLKKEKTELEKENAELRKIAEFQQSSNMSRHFENKKLKEGLAVGSTFNKALNSMNKNLEEERDKYRNMVFDKNDQLTKAKELLERLLITSCNSDVLNLLPNCSEVLRVRVEAEQFLSENSTYERIQKAKYNYTD